MIEDVGADVGIVMTAASSTGTARERARAERGVHLEVMTLGSLWRGAHREPLSLHIGCLLVNKRMLRRRYAKLPSLPGCWPDVAAAFDNAPMSPTLLRSAALIEGLRLDDELPVGGLVVAPVPHEAGFAGQELRETFNDLLAAHGFVSAFDRPIWGAQLATRRRLAFVATPPVEVEQVVPASMEATRTLGRLVDALALTHGGAPRIFAATNEFSADGGESWRTLVSMVGSGTHPGNILERLLPDGDRLTAIDPRDIWARAESAPVVALWLSLYRGVSAEGRWDIRVLRACSLLEAIGRELLDRETAVVDESGNALLDHGGRPATTGTLRGLMYILVRNAVDAVVSSPRVLLTHDTASFWDEVGVWADVRNMVGHEGQWLPPALPSTLKEAQRRSAAAFELAGRGDGYDAGAHSYADAVSAGTEAVLRAAVLQKIA